MNENYSICTDILDKLKSAGFPAAFLPYDCLTKIAEIYNKLPLIRENTPFIQGAVKRFHDNFQPDISFKPLSFLIAAFKCEPAIIMLNINGKQTAINIPPIYLYDAEQRQKFNELLKSVSQGFQIALTKGISQKLLAVLSGLGKYGRNNICYINEFGSFFCLYTYYTNIPCDDISYPVTFLDNCESCDLCRQNCPTGAIDQYSVINAEKCLTLYNERKEVIPDWIPQNIHHTLIGCLRCQEICPHNKPITENLHTLELNESETQAFLYSDPEAYPYDLMQKLKQFGFNDFLTSVAGRNALLALCNNDIG